MSFSITVNGTALPSGVTKFTRGDELLWSEGTGRGASSGLLVGSIIAQKQTYSVEWGMLTHAEYTALRNAIPNGFFTLVATANGTTICNITAYRGAITENFLGTLTTNYWRDVAVEFVQR